VNKNATWEAVLSDGKIASDNISAEKTFHAPEHLHALPYYYFFIIKFLDKPIKFLGFKVWTKKGVIDYGFDSDKEAKNLLESTGAKYYRRIYIVRGDSDGE